MRTYTANEIKRRSERERESNKVRQKTKSVYVAVEVKRTCMPMVGSLKSADKRMHTSNTLYRV